MEGAGPALMGIGTATGEHRAAQAAEAAVSSPLLETSIVGATRLLVNITAGSGFTLMEANEAMRFIQSLADADNANIILGHVRDEALGDEVRITVLAAGVGESWSRPAARPAREAHRDSAVVQMKDRGIAPAPPLVPREPAEATASPTPPAERHSTDEPTVFTDEDLDVPAFLRQYRQNKQ
jgi:cell division protein FtsZ